MKKLLGLVLLLFMCSCVVTEDDIPEVQTVITYGTPYYYYGYTTPYYYHYRGYYYYPHNHGYYKRPLEPRRGVPHFRKPDNRRPDLRPSTKPRRH